MPSPTSAHSSGSFLGIAVNGYLHAVAEQAAISDKSGTTELVICPTGESDNRLIAMMPSLIGDVISVKMVSLDGYFDAETKIDFLKIDAQGSETAILRGARRVIGQSPDIRIVMEYSPYALANAHETPSGFFDLVVNDLGLTIAELDENGEKLVTIDDLLARSWTNGNDQTTVVLRHWFKGYDATIRSSGSREQQRIKSDVCPYIDNAVP